MSIKSLVEKFEIRHVLVTVSDSQKNDVNNVFGRAERSLFARGHVKSN